MVGVGIDWDGRRQILRRHGQLAAPCRSMTSQPGPLGVRCATRATCVAHWTIPGPAPVQLKGLALATLLAVAALLVADDLHHEMAVFVAPVVASAIIWAVVALTGRPRRRRRQV